MTDRGINNEWVRNGWRGRECKDGETKEKKCSVILGIEKRYCIGS